jgi:hypothetical protein
LKVHGRWTPAFASLRRGKLDFGLNLQPCFNVLLETFLRFQVFDDDDDWPVGEDFLKKNGKERLRSPGNTGARQRSAILQSPREGLHSGRLCDISEQMACHRRCRVLRQAGRKVAAALQIVKRLDDSV